MDIEQEYQILKRVLNRFNVSLIRDTGEFEIVKREDVESYRLYIANGDIVIIRKTDGTFVFYNEFHGVNYEFIMNCFYRMRDRKSKINKILCNS